MSENAISIKDNLNLIFSLGNKNSLFLLLGNYLFQKKLINCTPVFFAHARIEAETTAWDKANIKEVNLTHIYKELAYILHFSREEYEKIMSLECTLEWMLMKNIHKAEPDNLTSVQEKHLILYGNFDQKAFQSNDVPASLFQSQYETEGFGLKNLFNTTNPAELDFTKVRISDIISTRFENILDNSIWETHGLSSAMAGASKIVRITRKPVSAEQKVLMEIATGVIAPTLIGYALWILKRAQDLKLKKLLFFKENGFLLYNIACTLKEKLQISIDLNLLSAESAEKDYHQIGIMETKSDFALVNIFHREPHQNNSSKDFSASVCFYLTLEEKNNSDSTKKEGYLWDTPRNLGYKNILANIHSIITPFFLPQKTEGKDSLYDRGTASSVEEFQIMEVPEGDEKIIFEAVEGFTKNLFLSSPFVNPYTDLRSTLVSLIKAFARNPTSGEAKVWSRFLKNTSPVHYNGNSFAKSFQVNDFFGVLKDGNNFDHKGRWQEGSLSLTPKPLNSLIRLGFKIGSRVGKIRKRVKM